MKLSQLKRLRKEYSDIEEKQEKLVAFMKTDKFDSLSAAEQHLLVRQLFAMECYASMLELRLEIYEREL
jgi:hypothetical protein